MKVAKAKGRLRGKQPKLTACQQAHLLELHRAGGHTSAELAELFGVARATVYEPSASPAPPSTNRRPRQRDRPARPGRAGGPTRRDRSLLSKIEQAALDETAPVVTAPRHCLALGGRAGSAALRDWASKELQGYGPDDGLPAYRVVPVMLKVDAADRLGRPVGGAGPVEVGQHVDGSPFEGPAEGDHLA
jgi:AbiTii/Helix-turn-helix domain of resolvase